MAPNVATHSPVPRKCGWPPTSPAAPFPKEVQRNVDSHEARDAKHVEPLLMPGIKKDAYLRRGFGPRTSPV